MARKIVESEPARREDKRRGSLKRDEPRGSLKGDEPRGSLRFACGPGSDAGISRPAKARIQGTPVLSRASIGIVATTYLMKVIVAVLDTPFVYIAKRWKERDVIPSG